MGKRLKIFIGVTGGFLLLVFLAGLYLPGQFEQKLRDALIKEFATQTRNNYHLALNDIDISFWQRSITADSISITSTSGTAELRSVKARSLRINGINWLSLLNRPFPEFRMVVVNKPEVELLSRPISPPPAATTEAKDTTAGEIEFSTFDIQIKDGIGTIHQENGAKVFSLDSFDLFARQVNLNTVLKGSYVPYLEELSFSGKNLEWILNREYYTFSIEEFAFSKLDGMGMARNLAFTPMIDKYDFARIKGHQLDRFDLQVDTIRLEGLDLDSLNVSKVEISQIDIAGAWLEVFHDKHMPPGQGIRYKPLLNKVAHQLGFIFSLDQTNISNSTIIYGEHKPESDSAGYISFNDLDARISNIRSAAHPLFEKDTLFLHTESRFLDAAPLTIDITYPVFDGRDVHRVEGRLGPINPKAANGILRHVAFIEVKSGMVHEIKFEMTLDSELAQGRLWLDYEDLKINLLEQANSGNTNFKTRFASFIANNFVMKSGNPENKFRVGEIFFERERDKSIFAYWWKSILSGIKSSIK